VKTDVAFGQRAEQAKDRWVVTTPALLRFAPQRGKTSLEYSLRDPAAQEETASDDPAYDGEYE
jgi:hypothetical protein